MKVRQAALDFPGKCGAVGLYHRVHYVFCGLADGHEGQRDGSGHEYAPRPDGTSRMETEPVPGEGVVPVPLANAGDVSKLMLLLHGPARAAGD